MREWEGNSSSCDRDRAHPEAQPTVGKDRMRRPKTMDRSSQPGAGGRARGC